MTTAGVDWEKMNGVSAGMTNKALWRLLVPTVYEDTKGLVSIRHHRNFDKFAISITGGLTVAAPNVKGLWINDGKEYVDRTIPVDIYCTESQIKKIALFAKRHYRQLSIMYFRLTDQVYFV